MQGNLQHPAVDCFQVLCWALLRMQHGGMACAGHPSPLVLSRSLEHCRTARTVAITFLCGLARLADGLCCSSLDAEAGLCRGCPLL